MATVSSDGSPAANDVGMDSLVIQAAHTQNRFGPGVEAVHLAGGLVRQPRAVARRAGSFGAELVTIARGGSNRQPPKGDRRFADPAWFSVDGLRLRFVIRLGDSGRTPLLICNGIGASLDLLEPLLMALGDHPFIAFDAPGTGESSTPMCPPTLNGIADTVVRALDELGVPVVDALGASWGGALAQVLARRHPQRIRRLVLASTGAGGAVVPGHPRAVAALLTPWRYWSQAHLTRIAPILYGPEIREDPHFMDQQRELRFTIPPSMRGYVWQMLALRGFASVLWLGRLSQPTLVMHGSDDPILPAVNARILATRIPHARLTIIPGGGHLFMLTRAHEVAGLLRDFLGSDSGVAGADCATTG